MRTCKCGAPSVPIHKGQGLSCDDCHKAKQRVAAAKRRKLKVVPSIYVSPSIDTFSILQRKWG